LPPATELVPATPTIGMLIFYGCVLESPSQRKPFIS